METLTFKVPDFIKQKLKSYAKSKGLSRSEVVRNALLEYLEKGNLKKEGTFYDLSSDLAGSVNDAADLSSNKDHLSDYGK